MFIVTFVIMLPVLGRTNDPVKVWKAGLTWVSIQSLMLVAGGFVAPIIRRIMPRAALLGTQACVSITFISMRPANEKFATPAIGVLCFAVILLGWFAGLRCWRGLPAGPVAIAPQVVIAWGSAAFSLGIGGMSLEKLGTFFASLGFSVPVPAVGHVFGGFEFLGVILVTAIPFGIHDLVAAMDASRVPRPPATPIPPPAC
jgi:AGZA family xanthine/uracil permease-like MFS transporter